MARRSLMLTVVSTLVVLAAAPVAAAQRPSVPRGWLGVTADGPLTGPDAPRFAGEWDRIRTAGAGTVRIAFAWDALEPFGAGAYDFTGTDALVAEAARRRLPVLPVVQRTPAWAAQRPADGAASPPRDPAEFARLLTALVARYGPAGSLWRERPDLPRTPIRAWQIWNEPSLTRYWSVQPFAPGYVRLLEAAAAAIRRADRGARVVLAGLPNESFAALRSIYRAGGRGAFDAVALHPYTGRVENVVRLIEAARREMRRAGDLRTPVWLTELSWPAAAGKVRGGTLGFETTDRGQASRLRAALRLLAERRRTLRIGKVVWYTWLSEEGGANSFAWSGLRRLRDGRVRSAPALRVFAGVARR